jgi:hypothetical protein
MSLLSCSHDLRFLVCRWLDLRKKKAERNPTRRQYGSWPTGWAIWCCLLPPRSCLPSSISPNPDDKWSMFHPDAVLLSGGIRSFESGSMDPGSSQLFLILGPSGALDAQLAARFQTRQEVRRMARNGSSGVAGKAGLTTNLGLRTRATHGR